MQKAVASIMVGIQIFILVGCLNLSSDTSSELIIESVVPSPKTSSVATSYLKMGGGAAGWCYKYVNLRKSDEPFDANKTVFTTRCSSALEVEWTNENNLSINYSDEALFKPEAQ